MLRTLTKVTVQNIVKETLDQSSAKQRLTEKKTNTSKKQVKVDEIFNEQNEKQGILYEKSLNSMKLFSDAFEYMKFFF